MTLDQLRTELVRCASLRTVPQSLYKRNFTMDAERINLIGTRLNDLRQRTVELRGYL